MCRPASRKLSSGSMQEPPICGHWENLPKREADASVHSGLYVVSRHSDMFTYKISQVSRADLATFSHVLFKQHLIYLGEIGLLVNGTKSFMYCPSPGYIALVMPLGRVLAKYRRVL